MKDFGNLLIDNKLNTVDNLALFNPHMEKMNVNKYKMQELKNNKSNEGKVKE